MSFHVACQPFPIEIASQPLAKVPACCATEVLSAVWQPGTEEDYQIVDDHIQLEPVVRDAVLLAMPVNPVCKPDCKGLCPECGADRNVTDCGHAGGRVDLRWEPLKQLRVDRTKE